jgi:delta 1-pyrroline-5-carboxylate dehydrogenase
LQKVSYIAISIARTNPCDYVCGESKRTIYSREFKGYAVMKYPTKMLINGSLVDGDRALEVKNPATGKTFVTVACGSERQADEALQAAKAVQPA